MKICLQAGHENTTTGSTGAPNEMSFNVDIRNQVAGELRRRGFEVATTDANADKDPNITKVDWDLFLAIHYDADVYGKGGYFVDFPEPSTDGATKESQRICKVLSDEYGKVTGIVNHPERTNANTRYYYLWKSLSAKTPCNLIECGVGMHVPDDWQILHFDRPRVVEAITRGICTAFNVVYDLTPPPPVVVPSTCEKELQSCNINLLQVSGQIKQAKDILYSKGFIWTKLNKLKALLPK